MVKDPKNLFPDNILGFIVFGLVFGIASGFTSKIGNQLGEAFIKTAGRKVEEATPEDDVPPELK